MAFGYPLLIIINLIILWVLKILKNNLYSVQLILIKFLFILLIPVIIIAFEL
jgi:hypothetical protein